ncbi:MAG: hypothetical protein EA370_16105 [Wenzhouxiangella sp.]|nr:MAG: hypothetical protein EA370_16105 [Wenzhouxiangella sp.]
MSIAGFTSLQSAENALVPAALGDPLPEWLLEIAPVTAPSPALDVDRSRLLFDRDAACWPFRCRLDELPLDDDAVPAVLLRHVWQPGLSVDPLDEVLRVLKPGGLLVSVSANPWHRRAWQELGRSALRLPSWPHFQVLHARHSLSLSVPSAGRWRGLVPGLTSVLVLVAHKPRRPARVEPIKFRRPQLATGSAQVSLCRAA